MKINRDKALKLWEEQFGNILITFDFAGRRIAKVDYGNTESTTGWNLDHIKPLSKEGTSAEWNLICCHINTNREKDNDYPKFHANGSLLKFLVKMMLQG